MINQKEILKKYEEFNMFLESIHIDELKKHLTRQELVKFQEEIKAIKIRSLSFEISKLIDEMKQEEFPQLLGIHHYPELNEIDFMSEKKKLELDKYLIFIRKGEHVYNLIRFSKDTNKLSEFLLDKGIVEKTYSIVCPYHSNERIKSNLTIEELNEIKVAIQTQDMDFLEEFYDTLYFCNSCDDSVEYKEWEERYVKVDIRKIKERDTSLDNV